MTNLHVKLTDGQADVERRSRRRLFCVSKHLTAGISHNGVAPFEDSVGGKRVHLCMKKGKAIRPIGAAAAQRAGRIDRFHPATSTLAARRHHTVPRDRAKRSAFASDTSIECVGPTNTGQRLLECGATPIESALPSNHTEPAPRRRGPVSHRPAHVVELAVEAELQRQTVRYDCLCRDGRGTASEVGDVIAHRSITVVSYGRHDRLRAQGNRPTKVFVGEGQQVDRATTAASEHNDVDVVGENEFVDRSSNRLRGTATLDGGFDEANGETGKSHRHNGLDISTDRGLGPAHHADPARQHRDRTTRTIDQPFRGKSCANLQEESGDRPLANRNDLLGLHPYLHLALLERDPANDGDSFTVDDAALAGAPTGDENRKVERAIAKREPDRPLLGDPSIVHITFDLHPARNANGASDLGVETGERHHSDSRRRRATGKITGTSRHGSGAEVWRWLRRPPRQFFVGRVHTASLPRP